MNRPWAVSLLLTLIVPSVFAEQPAPSLIDVAYGPHERNVLDLWQAKSDAPTPLLVFIHGGGFVNGDKRGIRNNSAVKQSLDAGVSFASINYRFRQHAPIQDILRDAARAIQFIRLNAKKWNLDPARIASYGGSAGAGTSLWLAFHDDLADPQADDPLFRQSTRLTAAGSLNGQASYDLRDWRGLLGETPFERPSSEWLAFYGFDSPAELESPVSDKIMRDCSMLGLISADDPPVAVACGQTGGEVRDRGHYLHHPKHSTAIAERCKATGVNCLLLLKDDGNATRDGQSSAVVAFLIEKLKQAKSN